MLISDVLVEFDLEQPRTEPLGDLAALMHATHLPALSVALIADGRIADTLAIGEVLYGSGEAVSPQTPFQAASISKSIAAFCVLRLAADGVLDLDADVNGMLRTWRVPANGGWAPVITLRQLLSHTAGTTTHGFLGYPVGRTLPSLPDILDGRGNSDPVRVTALPGTAYRYSGGGYTVVQQLLHDVTGRGYAELAQELVLDPIGMTGSRFDQGHRPGFASGHHGGPSPIPGGAHRYPELAAAGLWSTPTDLGRFLLAVQASARGDADALLPKELAEAMLTSPTDAAYGLGLTLGPDASWFGHNGGNEGFLSTARLYQNSGTGVVIMTNGAFGMLVINQFLLPKLAAAMDWPDAPPPPERSQPAIAGRYGQFHIEEGDGGLVLVTPGQPTVELKATDRGWRSTSLNLDIRFGGDELIIAQDGIETDLRLPRSSEAM
ncbi:serine hydrolase domain-containing protein [Rhizocola hellebori]|nr:serine hydrolase domain-containing protein [Rhizocola hellebori]